MIADDTPVGPSADSIEVYTPERKAEFLLSTATTDADYQSARKEVRKLGINPDSVPHRRRT